MRSFLACISLLSIINVEGGKHIELNAQVARMQLAFKKDGDSGIVLESGKINAQEYDHMMLEAKWEFNAFDLNGGISFRFEKPRGNTILEGTFGGLFKGKENIISVTDKYGLKTGHNIKVFERDMEKRLRNKEFLFLSTKGKDGFCDLSVNGAPSIKHLKITNLEIAIYQPAAPLPQEDNVQQQPAAPANNVNNNANSNGAEPKDDGKANDVAKEAAPVAPENDVAKSAFYDDYLYGLYDDYDDDGEDGFEQSIRVNELERLRTILRRIRAEQDQ